MTRKRVVDVGNCDLDHGTIRDMLERSFDVDVERAVAVDDTLELLEARPADLVIVNRRLEHDGSDGIDVLRAIKDDPRFASVPVMIITNYPEYQEAAVLAGAEPGFGKLSLDTTETRQRLEKFLR